MSIRIGDDNVTVVLGMSGEPGEHEDVSEPGRPAHWGEWTEPAPPPPAPEHRRPGHTSAKMPVRIRWDRNPAGWLVVNRAWLARKLGQ